MKRIVDGPTGERAFDLRACAKARLALSSEVTDESEFIDAVHHAFPYDDAALATALTRQALHISANAAFMVLHEVLFPPEESTSAGAGAGARAALDVLNASMSHPLKGALLSVAERLRAGERLSLEEVANLLRRIESFHGQYNALAIGYRAYAGTMPGVGKLYTSILGRWQRQRWLD